MYTYYYTNTIVSSSSLYISLFFYFFNEWSGSTKLYMRQTVLLYPTPGCVDHISRIMPLHIPYTSQYTPSFFFFWNIGTDSIDNIFVEGSSFNPLLIKKKKYPHTHTIYLNITMVSHTPPQTHQLLKKKKKKKKAKHKVK